MFCENLAALQAFGLNSPEEAGGGEAQNCRRPFNSNRYMSFEIVKTGHLEESANR